MILSIPPLVGLVLYSPEMERITPDQIAPELINHGTEKIFVKPAEGSGGMGIVVFNKNDKDPYQTQQNLLLNREFLATIGKQGDISSRQNFDRIRKSRKFILNR